MMTVANGGLRHLSDEGLCIAQQQMQNGTVTFELVHQILRFESKGMPGALNNSATRSGPAPHKYRNSNYPVVADDGNFRRRSIFHDIEQRNDGAGREVHMTQRRTRLGQRFAQNQLDGFSLRYHPAPYGSG